MVNGLGFVSHTVSVATKTSSKLNLAHWPQFANPALEQGSSNSVKKFGSG